MDEYILIQYAVFTLGMLAVIKLLVSELITVIKLIISELDDIISRIKRLKKKFNDD